ncbi:MAG: M10 family metallopeptidase C-terminal domain-containing protein, partial [Alphaproteobacteria bacterium]|nr:M10 family metallopeptidase C-terminal domain-containing protein [Alphaproteobacteria bacterium]
MQTATREIMTEIGKLVNISFIETTNINQTDMVFGQAQLDPDAGAWAYYPGSYAQAGDVWTNIQYASSTQDMTKGGYGYYVLWHEIGHALGLQHTFEAFNLAYDNNAIENTEQYSVMAYNWSTWGNTFAESYMLYDIAALQEMYGANTTHASHSGNNTYVLRSGDAYAIWDGGGTDTLDGSAISSAMTLRLEEGQFSSVGLTDNITIAWNTIIENATGGSGNDQIYGNSANNILLGNAGADTLYASTGSDTLNGGDGTDTANYTSYSLMDFFFNFVNATTVTLNHLVDGWTDTLIAIENYVFGGTTYTRAELEDVAPSDLDIIHVGFSNGSGGYEYYSKNEIGVETVTAAQIGLSGISGNVVTYNRSYSDLAISILHADTPDMYIKGMAGDDNITVSGSGININIIFQGNAGDDSIVISVAGDDNLKGHDGNDTISAGVGDDYIDGGNGNDTLSGGADNDTIYGRADNDIINGDAGDDNLFGNEGDDELYGGTGNDIMRAGAGADYMDGGGNDDTMYGDEGDDEMYGNSGADFMNGGAGADLMYGGTANDTMYGDIGNDIMHGENGNDFMNGDAGDDEMYGEANDDTLNGGAGADYMDGGSGNDVLNGGDDNDEMYGGLGNDILRGEDGDDEIHGGDGTDQLYGGIGIDTLYGDAGIDNAVRRHRERHSQW